MSDLAKIATKVMSLAPAEREHPALSAWESLGKRNTKVIV